MSLDPQNLQNGRYVIQSLTSATVRVKDRAVVVSEHPLQVWTIEYIKERGGYYISTGIQHCFGDPGQDVYVGERPIYQAWAIKMLPIKIFPPQYTIELLDKEVDREFGWTLTSTDPGSPVAVRHLSKDLPQEQIWWFVPVLED